MTIEVPPTLGLVLAGGQARRMGGRDKALARIGAEPLLDRVLKRFTPQCDGVILNANGDLTRFASFRLPVVPDGVPDFVGPLAGVLAGLEWAAAQRPETTWLATVPADCPFIPRDLVRRLHEMRLGAGQPLVCATSAGRRHPVAALWRTDLCHDLRTALIHDRVRKVEDWTARHGVALADWPTIPIDPFFNVNTTADLAKAAEIAARHGDL